mmetsp:Transcript_47019/g.132271  ORF Transcript_47019/g.132271 Transcript_47019/m.132271 type:complete len:96 (+) Transcript_47019:551-838(+)
MDCLRLVRIESADGDDDDEDWVLLSWARCVSKNRHVLMALSKLEVFSKNSSVRRLLKPFLLAGTPVGWTLLLSTTSRVRFTIVEVQCCVSSQVPV